MASPACTYPATLEERVIAVLELLRGRGLALLAQHGEERQAAALVVTAVKATAVLAGGGVCRQAALERFVGISGRLMALLLEHEEETARLSELMGRTRPVGGGEMAAEQQQEQQQQQRREQRAKLLRLLTLCMARWLPWCAVLLPRARAEAEAGLGPEAGGGPGVHALLLGSGCRMVRLAGLARGAAQGRGDARGAQSWGRLLAACGGLGEG